MIGRSLCHLGGVARPANQPAEPGLLNCAVHGSTSQETSGTLCPEDYSPPSYFVLSILSSYSWFSTEKGHVIYRLFC